MSWLGGVLQRWIALVSLAATVAGIATFAITEHIAWAWLAIGGLGLLVVSLGWTARDEHTRRLQAEAATHQPPGGGIPLPAPVEYQVDALRQVIPRLAETRDQFGRWELEQTLRNIPRRRVDPAYEPLGTYDEGLARLAELGELEALHQNAWRIINP